MRVVSNCGECDGETSEWGRSRVEGFFLSVVYGSFSAGTCDVRRHVCEV